MAGDVIATSYFSVRLWAKAVEEAQSFDVQRVKRTMLTETLDAPEGLSPSIPTPSMRGALFPSANTAQWRDRARLDDQSSDSPRALSADAHQGRVGSVPGRHVCEMGRSMGKSDRSELPMKSLGLVSAAFHRRQDHVLVPGDQHRLLRAARLAHLRHFQEISRRDDPDVAAGRRQEEGRAAGEF